MKRIASCTCGQLQAETEGEPVRVSVCHCDACQRRTGSVFGAQARFPEEAVIISGKGTDFVRTSESGRQCRFTFCPHCGSTVYYQPVDVTEKFIAIPIGAFADPHFPAPQFSMYEEYMHSWVSIPTATVHD